MPEPHEADLVEVVDAELVEQAALPVPVTPPPRPVVDRHTVLVPGELPPTEDDQPRYTAADFYVTADTADKMADGKARNTRSNYDSQRRIFAQWCAEQGRVARPCTTATYIEYTAHLIRRGLAPSSVETITSAIRTWMPEDARPGRDTVKAMIAAWAREWAGRGNRPDQGDPILLTELRALLQTCADGRPADLRDAALLSLGWHVLARRSELADRTRADLAVRDDGVRVYFASSKSDQAARGAATIAPTDQDPLLDPVRRVRAWLEFLDSCGVQDGPVWRALTRAGTFQSRTTAGRRGEALSGDAIGAMVKRRAKQAGLRNWSQIRAHGLRSGPATEMADAGLDDDDIAAQGRWKKGSRVVRERYVRPAQERRTNPMSRLAALRREADARADDAAPEPTDDTAGEP